MLYSRIKTRQASIALLETRGEGFPVLFLHGNSSSSAAFYKQFESPLADRYRFIAIDLPGHGASDNAADPKAGYTIPGFADTVVELIDALGVEAIAVVGWSLGGHVGIELLDKDPRIAGLMAVGTPPVSGGVLGLLRGFHKQFDLTLTTKGRLTRREMARLARLCFGDAAPQNLHDAIARADWRMRKVMGHGLMMGAGVDQKKVVEHSPVPFAVVNGKREPFARLDYLAGLDYANLWDGQCHVIDAAGHAPFLEAPEQFNALLGRFINDAAAYAANSQASGLHRRHG
ncbi:alpha/beta fold hydrolase [Pelagibacterium sp.]|uniref:alpha/beta fold hydrolase n=1 Tax=Pelagibacterium sp. TaxID=1967288 RepID=UPI003A9554A9